MTYPDPSVQRLIAEHFVPLKLYLHHGEGREHFREYRVIWTPTIVILDRRGAAHYQSPGYLPPAALGQMLRIGLARAQLAWARYDEAASHLEAVVMQPDASLADEALYWLGIARYLKTRKRAPMMEAWNRLRDRYPLSIWAARVPLNQEDEPEEQ